MEVNLLEETGMSSLERIIDHNKLEKTDLNTFLELLKPTNLSFSIERCSRLATHIICETLDSYTQQSQRYVPMDSSAYIIPQEIENSRFKEDYVNLMNKIFNFYNKITEAKEGEKRGRGSASESYKYGIPIEDGRYILPLATTSNILVTMSGDKIPNFINTLCSSPQQETYEIAMEVLKFIPPAIAKSIIRRLDPINQSELFKAYKPMFDKINKNVVLFDHFNKPLLRVALGGVTSTNPNPPSEVYKKWAEQGEEVINQKSNDISSKITGYGHVSISEHARHVYGSEQSLTSYHQFERHRLARNIREPFEEIPVEREIFIPPSIRKSMVYEEFLVMAEHAKQFRKELIKNDMIAASSYLLLNADGVKVITNSNSRIDMEMLRQRTCNNAQWEIRDRANAIIELLMPLVPVIYKRAGPPCTQGKCPEGELSCGKSKEMREKYGYFGK